MPWSELQPILVQPDAERAWQVARVEFGEHHPGILACRKKLQLPADQLDPPPLLKGDDLIRLGIEPGPAFSQLLQQVRAAQLDSEIDTRQQATELVESIQTSEDD